MTPESQRIAIAEACGIELQQCVRPRQYVTADMAMDAGDRSMEGSLYSEEEWEQIEPPDYLNDLNAMHEAEKVLMEEDRSIGCSSNPSDHAPLKYDIFLMHVVCGHKGNYSPFDYFKRSTATASQRAEAFLRTLNLWKD